MVEFGLIRQFLPNPSLTVGFLGIIMLAMVQKTITILEEVALEMKEVAKVLGISESVAYRAALRQFLDNQKQQVELMRCAQEEE